MYNLKKIVFTIKNLLLAWTEALTLHLVILQLDLSHCLVATLEIKRNHDSFRGLSTFFIVASPDAVKPNMIASLEKCCDATVVFTRKLDRQ